MYYIANENHCGGNFARFGFLTCERRKEIDRKPIFFRCRMKMEELIMFIIGKNLKLASLVRGCLGSTLIGTACNLTVLLMQELASLFQYSLFCLSFKR